MLGQRTQLGRALANIVGNAVKFTGTGGRVRVSTAEVPGERAVRLVCCDEGMGIPQAEQSRLFTRFFRASNATKNEIPGTGLGLVVVRGIVDAHGGTLSLSSVEGVGYHRGDGAPLLRRARRRRSSPHRPRRRIGTYPEPLRRRVPRWPLSH